MTGINKAPILLNLESELIRINVDLQARPIGKGAIVAVVFQNGLSNDDGSGNNLELQWGIGSIGQPWNMLPGQESPVIYAHDLEDIYVRTRVAIANLSAFQVTALVYKLKPEHKRR